MVKIHPLFLNIHCTIKTMKEKETYKIETLLSEFSKQEYLTAEAIAEKLGVSVKTARNRIAEVNQLITPHGAEITSRARFGYRLDISDPQKWDEYIRSRSLLKEMETGTPEERTTFVALSLLMAADYIKITDFADELYVSPQVISQTLKECEKIFTYYHLSLERKPYYGLRLIGREFDKRNCIISSFLNEFEAFLPEKTDAAVSKQIFQTLIGCLQANRIHLTEISLQSTAAYCMLSIQRFQAGFSITADDISPDDAIEEHAAQAASAFCHAFRKDVSEAEIHFLGVYISAMRSNDAPEYRTNIVITQKIDRLVVRIFDVINSVFSVEFHNNLRLHMMLAQHLLSLDLRVRYHIPLNSEIYLNVQKDFPFSYAIANEALSVLIQEYQTEISPSEADWLALIFATGLQDIQATQKLNVLVVSSAGRASAQLFKRQIEKNYSQYVDRVETCNAYELEGYDLSEIDYIFSTSNIAFHTNIPILMIDNLDLSREKTAIESSILNRRFSYLDRFYSEEYFYTDLSGTTKEEILAQLCERISKKRKLPEGFYEALMERERLHSTDYMPSTAVPHPSGLIPEEDIVAVAILKKPVFWSRYQVQIVILSALSLKDEEAARQFYGITSHFLMDKKNIAGLLKSPDYKTFIALLSAVDLR